MNVQDLSHALRVMVEVAHRYTFVKLDQVVKAVLVFACCLLLLSVLLLSSFLLVLFRHRPCIFVLVVPVFCSFRHLLRVSFSSVLFLNVVCCLQILVKRDSTTVDKGVADPAFWGVMLVKPMLYGIMIPILYGLCKKLGKPYPVQGFGEARQIWVYDCR